MQRNTCEDRRENGLMVTHDHVCAESAVDLVVADEDAVQIEIDRLRTQGRIAIRIVPQGFGDERVEHPEVSLVGRVVEVREDILEIAQEAVVAERCGDEFRSCRRAARCKRNGDDGEVAGDDVVVPTTVNDVVTNAEIVRGRRRAGEVFEQVGIEG